MAIAYSHQKLEQENPQVMAAQQAEQRLFDYYSVDVKNHYVELGTGQRVRVIESGNGMPLLLMPGGVGDGWIWAPLMAELSGYRLLVVNRPGGGLSDGVDHRWVDVRELAVEVLTAVLNHFRLDQTAIIANSMGGLWSFWFALACPEQVSSLIQLGCPALILNTSAPIPMRLMSVPFLNRLLVKAMIPSNPEKARDMPKFLGHPQAVGDNWPEAMAACSYHFPQLPTYKTAWISLMEVMLSLRGSKSRYAFTADQLRRVQQPVRYVWGDSDPFGDLAAAHQAQQITANATLHKWQGGHLPWWDDSTACSRLIRAFLD